jgi:D-tagatose-1,6-bisphosphate aldolase subunit GatZ/KbaZ
MVADPARWSSYSEGDEGEQRIQRRYSYSDRLRYYLPDAAIEAAQERLLDNLAAIEIPLPLLSQYLPAQYDRVLRGELRNDPRALVMDRVKDALRAYAFATNPQEVGA